MNSRIDQTHTKTHPSVWFFEKKKKKTDLHHLRLSGYREKHTPQNQNTTVLIVLGFDWF